MIPLVLKKNMIPQVRSGHPWVMGRDLNELPKTNLIGSLAELRDTEGNFLARGYYNPESQIAFRILSLLESERAIYSPEFLLGRLEQCWQRRATVNLHQRSFRLCFAEADELPGLMVDRYLLDSGEQVFSIQISTAGMQRLIGDKLDLFLTLAEKAMNSGLSQVGKEKTAILLRNDIGVRELEGIKVEAPRLVSGPRTIDLKNAKILLDSPLSNDGIVLSCDLLEGQKTGFFLDQRQNIFSVIELLKNTKFQGQPVKILDLCCYVGHWSSQLAKWLSGRGLSYEAHLVDISKEALRFAEKNVKAQGNGKVFTYKRDVLKDLESLGMSDFDIVIADPPAFIKAKKDIPNGSHAYMKLNANAYKFTKSGGLTVSCSCSGHLDEELFIDVLKKSQSRAGGSYFVVAHGGHSPDHPLKLSFPEGRYLKMWASLKGAPALPISKIV